MPWIEVTSTPPVSNTKDILFKVSYVNTTDDVVHPGMGRGDDDRYKLPATVNLPGYSGYPQDRSARENMPVPHDEISESAAFASGKMSSVRRTFCLFVTFDLGLTFILWVIYTQLIGDVGWRAFERQVEAFTIKTSLFDTVMMATVRFVFLILAYALFRIRHWWTVALTTLLSSAFLLAKIFLFDFGESSKNPLSYCVLIVSFVLAWVETWFLDFKVLPWEKKEVQKMATPPLVHGYGSLSDRQRLLARDDAMSTATFDQYYSPVTTPEGSDTEEEAQGAASRSGLTAKQLEEYRQLATKSYAMLWDYLTMDEGEWKHQTGKTLQEGIIHSHNTKEYGKIFKLEGEVDIDPKSLWEEMIHNINSAPTWNPTLVECNTVMVIDNNTDISHNIAAGIGSLVASRDFVNLRHWGVREGIYLSAGHGVTHPDCPPSKKHIRGFNGPGGWVFKSVPGQPNKSIFIWVMNTDIKGWIPQRLMDQAASTVLQDYLKYLQQHALTLQPAV
ncbi:stAR-related lipid transfer protein 3-like isoform X2 [Littorina saxatilis]|uniref:stAR-related lipid transfer protein 3-like isoform X2 n=1 Tax=Littorina saxatilis TaxID=31220 RepID=UPI0038B4819F